MSDEHNEKIASERTWNRYREDIAKQANLDMRERFLSSDANVGTSILQERRKGLNAKNMFLLQQGWSPISWERQSGLHFEISELNMRALGEAALDPEIDQMIVDIAEDLLAENANDILTELIQDLITGDGENYEVIDD